MKKLKILSVNISKKKGIIKTSVDKITLNEEGIEQDAHAGLWHRQVSFLANESVERFAKDLGRKVAYGEFAENITTEGIEVWKCSPGDLFSNGEVELEVTQIGKKCHGAGCAIYDEVGKCIMPKEGIFCRVIKGGELKAGDELEYFPQTFLAKVITLSDRAFQEEYEDISGPLLVDRLQLFCEKNNWLFEIEHCLLPDDEEILQEELREAQLSGADLVLTTGGTGVGPRDFTVDAVLGLLDKEIPGVMEMIRMKYGAKHPNALLSRSVAGTIGDVLIYTLPGSVKAVNEYMDEIEKTLKHTIYMVRGIDAH